jgi:hypothetical protein
VPKVKQNQVLEISAIMKYNTHFWHWHMTANNLAKLVGYGLVLWLTLRSNTETAPTQIKSTEAYLNGIELESR